jgi:hypothetical protein
MNLKIRHRFKREFRRQLRMAISAAVGFIIAFAWKDTIFRLIEIQVQKLTIMTSALHVSFASSIITTIFGALIIVLSARLLRER